MPQNIGLARSFALVLLPFGACYFVAYTFRTINALVAPALISEFGLSASEIGVLTSVYFYFLSCAIVQLPLGALLDAFGPRIVQASLMAFAAAGAMLFGFSNSELSLLIGRAMIGLGMSVSLMAGLKAAITWLPRERLGLANSILVTLGALGSVAASFPAGTVMETVEWRGLLILLSAATAILSLIVVAVVPKNPPARTQPLASPLSFRAIYRDAFFWRIAPLSSACLGTAWALHSLWAAMWLTDVERLPKEAVVNHLFVMGLSFCGSTLLIGVIADHLRSRGTGPAAVLGLLAALFIALQTAILFRVPLPSLLLWAAFAGPSSFAGLSSLLLAEHFGSRSAGRVNACLNVLHLTAAFVVQSTIGDILERWPATANGGHPEEAYVSAFGTILVVQSVALLWFVRPMFVGWSTQMGRTYQARAAMRVNAGVYSSPIR